MSKWVANQSRAIRYLLGGACLLLMVVPLALNPYAELPFEPVKVTVLRWGVLGLFALALGIRVFVWSKVRWVLPLVLVWGVSTAVSFDPTLSLLGASDKHGFLTWLACLAVGLVVAHLPNDQEQIQQAILLGSFPVCVYGLMQLAGFDPLAWETDSVSVVLSTLGRSNFLAAYLALVIPLTLTAMQKQRGFAVLLVVQLLVLLGTQARAGWLAMMLGVVVWLVWQRPLTLKTHLAYPVVFVVLAGGLFFGVNRFWGATEAAPSVTTEPSYEEVRSASVDRRWIIWQATWELWWEEERPFVGYGSETFQTLFLERYPPGSLYDGRDSLVDDPHNLFLRLLWDVGVVGLLVWGSLMFVVLWQTRLHHGQMLVGAYVAGLAAYGGQAFFNPDVVTIELMFWIFMGGVMAHLSIHQ